MTVKCGIISFRSLSLFGMIHSAAHSFFSFIPVSNNIVYGSFECYDRKLFPSRAIIFHIQYCMAAYRESQSSCNCNESNEPSIVCWLNVMIADFIGWFVCWVAHFQCGFSLYECLCVFRIYKWNETKCKIYCLPENTQKSDLNEVHKSRATIISEIIIFELPAIHHAISKVHKLRDRGFLVVQTQNWRWTLRELQ